jgi:CubicO group peptidase (beta-lactamase class C family)
VKVGESLRIACEESGCPGAVVAIADGSGVETHAAGRAAIDRSEEMTADHQFPPMSIVKSMTAALVADMCTGSPLTFDTSVAEVLGAAHAKWAPNVTIDHLLACTSGLTAFHFPDTGDRDGAVTALVPTLGSVEPMYAPGSRFSYSNTGFMILGAILEAAAGSVFDDLLHDRVLSPLGLQDSGSLYKGEPSLPVTQHFSGPGGAIAAGWWKLRCGGPGGAGTVYATAADIARYGRAHIERWPELREPRANFPGPHAESWARGWAIYGWGGSVFGWDGFGPGAKTFLRVLPHHDTAIAIFTNGSNGRDVYRAVLPALLRERFGLEMTGETWAPNPASRTDSAEADRIVGRYRNGPAVTTVRHADGGYLLEDYMGRSLPIRAAGQGRFVAPESFEYPTLEFDGDVLTYFCSVWMRET